MTVRQTAEKLEISQSLVYSLLTTGKLKGSRHGLGRGTWRVSEEQLAEYLGGVESKHKPAPAEPVRTPQLKHLRLS
jgi:excisionase family DNA binding protein